MADVIVTNPEMIVDRNRLAHDWNIGEIFVPGGAGGRYVPNVNDKAYEFTVEGHYITYRVTDVDYTTGRSTLVLITELPRVTEPGKEDLVLSNAAGRASDAFRAYVNDKLDPITISLENREYFLGSEVQSIRIYLGTDTGKSGQIISAMYTQAGQLMGDEIPLEKVATAKLPNANVPEGFTTNVKVAITGYLSRKVGDNEILTVVGLSAAGSPVTVFPVLAVNTAFIASPDAFKKYVNSIAIKSPFLSDGDSQLLEFPLNMPLESLIAYGVVTYSDGSTKELPIDGKKFKIHGLFTNRYVATSAGQEVKLVLTYVLDKGELYYGSSVGQYNHISIPYRAVTLPANNAYSIKIFAFPEWVDSNSGYRMRYWLGTLSRNMLYDVTNIVRLALNSPAFEPKLYGTSQHLILNIDMNKVDGRFNAYRFVQPITVTLREDGSTADDAWSVNMNPGSDKIFGLGLKVVGDYINGGRYDLKIDMGAGSLADWFNRLFYTVDPLINPKTELIAPAPTHFRLAIGGLEDEYAVASWNKTISVPAAPIAGKLVRFEWIYRDGNGDKLLGVSAVAYYQVD